VSCPHCQGSAEFHSYRSRTPLSLLGSVVCRRAYYYCARCGRGLAPWDDSVGLTDRHLTPGAEQLTTLAGTLGDSFAEAAEEILPRLAGLHLSESTVERTTEDAGQRLGEWLDQRHTLGPRVEWEWHRDAQGRTCAYISIDAVAVHQQGPEGSAAPSRMPYVAMVYNPVPDLPAAAQMAAELRGEPLPATVSPEPVPRAEAKPAAKRMEARYLSGLYELGELGLQLRRQAAQVGMERAEQWIGLGDGGNGLEDFQRENFNRANLVLILDFHHPAEDLEELARLLHPGEQEVAKKQAEQWCHTMKHRGGKAILEELRALPVPQRCEVRERYEEILGYIDKNVHRMDYPYYISQGWQIGSGPVESACKTVVSARMKLAGMRWGEEGTDALCHLRGLFKSEKGQWDAFWKRDLHGGVPCATAA
jgi:hypothetical protein